MPRSAGLLALVAGLMVAASPFSKETPAQHDAERMQGTWKTLSFEASGRTDKSPTATSSRLVVIKDMLTFSEQDRVVFAGTFTLDPTHRAIDVRLTEGENKGAELRGIYEVSKDSLKCCLGKPGQKERPGRFGTWLTTNLEMTLKRE